jgi:hypothetical protein
MARQFSLHSALADNTPANPSLAGGRTQEKEDEFPLCHPPDREDTCFQLYGQADLVVIGAGSPSGP